MVEEYIKDHQTIDMEVKNAFKDENTLKNKNRQWWTLSNNTRLYD